ncbi:MAG: hypothetical protein FJ125_05165 [Deltaproteobacteria bacterium]|nr:hypothetical protein [Deltaproteobacteria bacterium]
MPPLDLHLDLDLDRPAPCKVQVQVQVQVEVLTDMANPPHPPKLNHENLDVYQAAISFQPVFLPLSTPVELSPGIGPPCPGQEGPPR